MHPQLKLDAARAALAGGLDTVGRIDCISTLVEDAVTRIVEGMDRPRDVMLRLCADINDYNCVEALCAWAAQYDLIEDRIKRVWAGLVLVPLVGDNPELDELFGNIARNAWAWGCRHWRPRMRAEWRTSTVVDLAAAIRDEKAFDRLPILADALQEAGCENEDMLDHLRFPGKHVHCCWVAELLLEPLV